MTDAILPGNTTAEPSTGKAAQLAAIRESGWGRPFRLFQPHNLAFWVYVLGVGAGTLTMLRYFGPKAAFYNTRPPASSQSPRASA
ncbi:MULTISPECIES: hypothetical protein [Saccharothrix]|uniref:hypothetical protein n=1 Tax=Saccharothrix TaxID=2071 RepID=UPI000963F394|nr:hypothetical protein [Saccharothrix sp. CB00851]OKI35482.1 hypothetical protein A6A25_23745 [Saccharothrix sp. CB00851]